MKPFEVSLVGRVYVDHVFAGFDRQPALGTEIYCQQYQRSVGGGAAISAYWLATMGRRVQVACVVGMDDIQWFRAAFERAGIDFGLVQSSATNSGVTAAVTLGNDREFFTNLGANRNLTKHLEKVGTRRRVLRARHLHVTAALPRRVVGPLIRHAHDAGLTVSMDVGFQPGWYAATENQRTLHDVDIFFPNAVEARLLGLHTRRGLREWLRVGSGGSGHWVVVKRGGKGAVAASCNRYVAVRPPPVKSIDTTGAGDAFDAGFLDGFLSGGDVRSWLQRACVCGALSVGELGGVAGAVSRPKVDEVLKETYGI